MSFRLLPVVVAIPVLALTIWAQAQESAPESTATSLLPEPAADKVASGVKTLKSLYASDYRRTQDSNKLQAQLDSVGLARKLLKTAEETPPDSDGYYPILSEAARLATVGNKPDVAFDAIDRLLKTHAIDASAMRFKVLTHFGQRTTRLTDVRTASRFVMPAIQAAADAQKIKTAQALLAVGETMAKRMFNQTMQKSLAQASELLELLRQQEEDVVAALKKIEQNPEDPVANLTVARFMGLRRGDWEGAEVYAALVDEDDIRSLFVREFAAPEDIKEILRLANDWWEFAETQSGAVKLQATELAAIRYASIVKQLKGFDQKQVETRLAGVVRDHVVAVRMPVMIKAGIRQPPEWINKGLVAYYPFNGNAKDESGNGNDGSVNGATPSADRHHNDRKSYSFDGKDDRFVVSDHHLDIFGKAKSSTMSLWVNIDPNSPRERHFVVTKGFHNETGSPGNKGNRYFQLELWNDGDSRARLYLSDLNTKTDIYGQKRKLAPGLWHHLVVVRGEKSAMYINGDDHTNRANERDKNKWMVDYEAVLGGTPFAFGAMQFITNDRDTYYQHHFAGQLDDIRIYNRALSADEVKALYEFEKAD